MALRILQWNCRSVFSALTDLKCLVSKLSPDVIILQESWLAPRKPFRFRNFRVFRLDRCARGGGLLILVSPQFCHRARMSFQHLSVECELLAVDFSLPGCLPFSLVNVYFPNGVVSSVPLDAALASCNRLAVFAGDFNSHHVAWGYRTDQCGRRLWDWVGDNGLTCHNSGTATFFRGRARSVLDLTFSTSRFVSSWDIVDYATSSDHLPVIFEVPCLPLSPQRRVQKFINYNRLQREVRSALSSLSCADAEHRAVEVTSVLATCIKKAEFVVSSTKSDSISAWWNEDCARAYRRRNAAWKKLIHNQCPANWNNYKFFQPYLSALLLTRKRSMIVATSLFFLSQGAGVHYLGF